MLSIIELSYTSVLTATLHLIYDLVQVSLHRPCFSLGHAGGSVIITVAEHIPAFAKPQHVQ